LLALQISVGRQVVLHAPQLVGSVASFTQRSGVPHMTWVSRPPAHGWQVPAVQLAVVAHTVPHPPQLFVSVFKSTQVVVAPVPHIRWLVGHTQALFTQLAPLLQAMPHPPQFIGSLLV
jgi:hypothetical protein